MSAPQTAISPSMLPNLAACRAFEPGTTCTAAAKRGTRIDKAIRDAWTARNGGTLFSEDFFLSELNPKDRKAVDWALQKMEALQAKSPSGQLFTEGVHIQAAPAIAGIGNGTLDGILPQDGALVEVKTGEKRDYIAQIAAYAAACCRKYKRESWASVILYVDKQKVETIRLDAATAEEIVRRTLTSPYKQTPGDQCAWCGAKCPFKNLGSRRG